MENVKIGIVLSSAAHREDLMRRLAEIAPGLEFVIDGSGDFTVTDEIADKYFPVDRLAAVIAEELGTRFTSLLRGTAGETMRTYLVRGGFGGCGCTSAGLTIARILAGRSGGRVAFISTGRGNDLQAYAEGCTARRSSRELGYLLSHGIEAEAADYAAEDRYGVWVFAAKGRTEHVLSWLGRQGFSAAVTDAGSSDEGRRLAAQAVINIECEGDCRGSDFIQRASGEIAEGSLEYYVLNKAAYRTADGHIFRIPWDGSSFVQKGGNIEIAMDRAYTAAIRELVSAIEKDIDDGQSDFYK